MTLDQNTIDRVAAAIESADVGYSLTLTRLVDGERTYTLTYDDGTRPLIFDDIDDGYEHIRERKRKAQAVAVVAALEVPEIDGGRFAEWSLRDIAGQCRMQSREQLDPEFSQFMAEVSNRLFGILAADAAVAPSDIEPRQPAQQNAACEDEQAKSSDAHHLDPQRTKTDAFCNQGREESRKLLAVTIATKGISE